MEDFRKNDLFYRYFHEDPFALETMIMIIENGNTDSIIDLYRDLKKYKSGFDEEKLFSNEKLSSLIVESLNNEILEADAIGVVIKLYNGTTILENRLESGLSKYPMYILSRLAIEGKSKIGLNYIEELINDTSQIESSRTQIQESLTNYIKFSNDEAIRLWAIELAVNGLLNKKIYSPQSSWQYSANKYKYPFYLSDYVIKYGNEEIIPYLLQLRKENASINAKYKLWEVGYELPESEVDELLKNKEVMLLMIENDHNKRLLNEVSNIYAKIFQGILSSNKINTISFWNSKLYQVVHYFKDENKEVFERRVRDVLESENVGSMAVSKMMTRISNLYELVNESKTDVLDYFESIGYITSEQHKKVKEKIEDEENESESWSENYFDISDRFNKNIAFHSYDYEDLFKSIETSQNDIFDDFSFVANTIDVVGDYGFIEKKPTEIIGIYKERAYVMMPEIYAPESFCYDEMLQDKFINFVNYILKENRIGHTIVPYDILGSCEMFKCLIGTTEQVDQISKKYHLKTLVLSK